MKADKQHSALELIKKEQLKRRLLLRTALVEVDRHDLDRGEKGGVSRLILRSTRLRN